MSKRWHNLIYILSSAIFSFGYATFSSCIWQQVAIFQLYRVINSPINIYLATVMSPFPSFISLAHIFLILKAIAKKAKSIVTLSSPTCRNLLYAMLHFICPNTASGSIHLLPLCLIPSSAVSYTHLHPPPEVPTDTTFPIHYWFCIRFPIRC